MTKAQAFQKIVVFTVLLSSVFFLLAYVQNVYGLDRLQKNIAQAGVWGPIIYIVLQLLTQIIAPISGSPIWFLALALFGRWAFLYLYIAACLSSITNFWIARTFGRDLVIKLVGHKAMDKIDKLAADQGVPALIFLRLFGGWIHDFVSYAAGFTNIPFSTYYLISLLATLPWLIIFFFVSSYLTVPQLITINIVVGFIGFSLTPFFYYLKNHPRKARH